MFKLKNTYIAPFILVFCLAFAVFIVTAQEKKSVALIKKENLLADVPFRRVVLYALIAAEENYKFKKNQIPKVNADDYYATVLNGAIRIALADTARIVLPGLQETTKKDSTKNKE